MTDFVSVSTFSSVGGMDLGFERAGIRTVAQCEIDPWRRHVLEHHWPGIARYSDVRDMAQGDEVAWAGRGGALGANDDRGHAEPARPGPARIHVDLLHGGFPCQDLSVAGARAGLAGKRSGLFHEFVRIADAVRPSWIVLENVPGLLSSNDGRDFGVVLGTLADLGYGLAWRVLDARFYGVPQRRRRVFIAGHLGDDGRSALHALCEGCEGSPEASRCSWQNPAAGAPRGPDDADYYVEDQVNGTLRANGKGGNRVDKQPLVVNTLQGTGGPNGKRGNRLDADSAAGGHLIPVEPQAMNLRGREEGIRPELDDVASLRSSSGGSSRSYVVGELKPGEDISYALKAHHSRLDDGDNLIAAPLTRGSSSKGVSAPGRRQEDDVNLVVAPTLRSHMRPGSNSDGGIALVPAEGVMGDVTHALTSEGHDASEDGSGRGTPLVAQAFSVTPEHGQGTDLRIAEVDVASGIGTSNGQTHDRGIKIAGAMGVRRLVPVECERLMSWPDRWTAPPGLKAPDSRRYAACGDGVVSNVSEWIGRRILAVEASKR